MTTSPATRGRGARGIDVARSCVAAGGVIQPPRVAPNSVLVGDFGGAGYGRVEAVRPLGGA